jgi:hypothetical protein
MKRFNAYRVELVVVVMIDEVDQVQLIRRGDRDVLVGRLVAAAAAAEVKCGVVVEETMVV